MKKLITTAIGSALLSGGAMYGATLTSDSAQVIDLKTEKHQILKDNVWKSVRLGETPEWDISVVSAEEITDAYVAVAKAEGALTQPNLYTALREKATALGVQCIK